MRIKINTVVLSEFNSLSGYTRELINSKLSGLSHYKPDDIFDGSLKDLEWLYSSHFPVVISSDLMGLIKIIALKGLDNSPLATRMIECYELGGTQAGWVGPRPQDGGKARDCLQLFHMGLEP